MISDNNPSVIFGLYCKPEAYNDLMQDIKKKGLGVRELRFIDVEIPLDEKYDDTINFFKSFVLCDYWKERNPLFKDIKVMGIDIKGKVIEQLKKMAYEPIEWKNTSWKNDKRHKLIYSLAVPLFVQNQMAHCTTQEEKDNMKKLLKFESVPYINDEDRKVNKVLDEIDQEAKDLQDGE